MNPPGCGGTAVGVMPAPIGPIPIGPVPTMPAAAAVSAGWSCGPSAAIAPPPPTATSRGRCCSTRTGVSMPVAITETRTRPVRLSSIAEPKMMLASSSTSSRMRLAA